MRRVSREPCLLTIYPRGCQGRNGHYRGCNEKKSMHLESPLYEVSRTDFEQGPPASCRAYGDSDCNWARRRLCDSLAEDYLGGEYAICAARSRAAATINLARPILAVVLRTLFGVSEVMVIVWRARMTSLFRPLPLAGITLTSGFSL